MYYTQLSINCINFGSAHFRNTRPAATITAPCRAVRPYKDLQWNANISHHRRMRRWPVISAAACFAIFLRGNCFRWERCLHAGGAVVQICRKNIVCWPQRSSTGSFCGLRYNPIRIQRLFLHTFSDKPEKVCPRSDGYSVVVKNGASAPNGNVGRTTLSALFVKSRSAERRLRPCRRYSSSGAGRNPYCFSR